MIFLVGMDFSSAQVKKTEETGIYRFEKVVQAESESKAREILTAKSSVEGVRAQGKKVLGSAQYNKNRVFIQQNLINQAAKYVRKITIEDLSVQSAKKYSARVIVEVSVKEIQHLLEGAGFFNSSSEALQAIAFISVKSEVDKQDYRWWFENANLNIQQSKTPSALHKISVAAEDKLTKALSESGIFLLQNNRFPSSKRLSNILRKKYLNEKELAILARKNGVDLIVRGSIEIDTTTAEFKLTVIHVKNARNLADVKKIISIENFLDTRQLNDRILEQLDLALIDLGQQLREASFKGQTVSKVIELSVSPAIKFNKLQGFKSNLVKKFATIKAVRERRLSHNLTVLEIELQGSKNILIENMRNNRDPGWDFIVTEDESDSIALKRK